MTLSAIRSRLGSLSPSKLAEIEAVSPCAVKILGDVGRLLDVAVSLKAATNHTLLRGVFEKPEMCVTPGSLFGILKPGVEAIAELEKV